MKFSYYNLDKDKYKERSNYKKKKLFTIYFNHILEMIQLENSDRGILFWIVLQKRLEYLDIGNKVEVVEVRNSIRVGLTTIVIVVK